MILSLPRNLTAGLGGIQVSEKVIAQKVRDNTDRVMHMSYDIAWSICNYRYERRADESEIGRQTKNLHKTSAQIHESKYSIKDVQNPSSSPRLTSHELTNALSPRT